MLFPAVPVAVRGDEGRQKLQECMHGPVSCLRFNTLPSFLTRRPVVYLCTTSLTYVFVSQLSVHIFMDIRVLPGTTQTGQAIFTKTLLTRAPYMHVSTLDLHLAASSRLLT
jgi:hypothetical protein